MPSGKLAYAHYVQSREFEGEEVTADAYILALPPGMMVRAGLDLLAPRRARNNSFEDYIIEKYGQTLYRAFFKPYTEKFLDYTCSNLHRDWAEAGINRL